MRLFVIPTISIAILSIFCSSSQNDVKQNTINKTILTYSLSIDENSILNNKYSFQNDTLIYKDDIIIKVQFIEYIYNSYKFSVSFLNQTGKQVVLDQKNIFYYPLYNDSIRFYSIDPFQTVDSLNKAINRNNYSSYNPNISKKDFDYGVAIGDSLSYIDKMNKLGKQKNDFQNSFKYFILKNNSLFSTNIYFPTYKENITLCFIFIINSNEYKFIFNNHIVADIP